MGREKIFHNIDPVYNENSEILILGTFPSVKSRQAEFFYGNEKNRFWKVISTVFCCPIPKTVKEKTELLLTHNIALWDVIANCSIEGSSDSSIKDVKPNDLGKILNVCNIKRIFANGKTAEKLYNRYLKQSTGMKITALPSTSPANASFSLERLVCAWKEIIEK